MGRAEKDEQGGGTISGRNGLPKVAIHSADGALAEIHLHGAHLTSWKTPDGLERLFLSPRAEFRAGAAIRGGVPVIFPQFSGLGPLPKHGFARNHAWDPVEMGEGRAHLQFCGNAETASLWPHKFVCEMLYRIAGTELEMTLSVTNTGDEPFDFHAALHGYFAVGSLNEARVSGLGGLRWKNNPTGSEHGDSEAVISFGAEVDRTYFAAGDRSVRLHDGASELRFTQAGFADTVVWNPGPEVGAKIGDLEPAGYRHYLCVEAASIDPPLSLKPGNMWRGTQRVEAK